MALTADVLRTVSRIVAGLAVLSCASVSARPNSAVEAIMIHSGGLSGITETIRISSTGGAPTATSELSSENEARAIRLPRNTLDSSLVVIESFVSAPPQMPADMGLLRPICGDVILTHIEVRRDGRAKSAQEECPHRTPASESYWQRVDSLYRLLASAAR
jgi:hypothetical protein